MSLTIRELDRLVSKTEMSPTAKHLLRYVRRAVVDGRAGTAVVSEASWTIPVDSDGTPVRFSFKVRRAR